MCVLWALDKPAPVAWNGAATVTDIMGGEHDAAGGWQATADPVFLSGLKDAGSVHVQ